MIPPRYLGPLRRCPARHARYSTDALSVPHTPAYCRWPLGMTEKCTSCSGLLDSGYADLQQQRQQQQQQQLPAVKGARPRGAAAEPGLGALRAQSIGSHSSRGAGAGAWALVGRSLVWGGVWAEGAGGLGQRQWLLAHRLQQRRGGRQAAGGGLQGGRARRGGGFRLSNARPGGVAQALAGRCIQPGRLLSAGRQAGGRTMPGTSME
jgi:hypothetical protein